MTAAIVILGVIVLALLWDRHCERREHAAQTADLLQRIQAPEVAVIQHQARELPPSPEPLPYDSDEAFHATREQMAEALR